MYGSSHDSGGSRACAVMDESNRCKSSYGSNPGRIPARCLISISAMCTVVAPNPASSEKKRLRSFMRHHRAGQVYFRRSSITLPSFGRLPGATSSTSPRSLVTSRIEATIGFARDSDGRSVDFAFERHAVVAALALDDQARAHDLGMAAHDLAHLPRRDEHGAHLGALVGAAHPALDAHVGAAAGARAGQHRRQIAGAEADQRIVLVEAW